MNSNAAQTDRLPHRSSTTTRPEQRDRSGVEIAGHWLDSCFVQVQRPRLAWFRGSSRIVRIRGHVDERSGLPESSTVTITVRIHEASASQPPIRLVGTYEVEQRDGSFDLSVELSNAEVRSRGRTLELIIDGLPVRPQVEF